MGKHRFWLSAIPKNHQRVGKKMGRQKDGVLSPGFYFFAQPFFCPLPTGLTSPPVLKSSALARKVNPLASILTERKVVS